MSSSYFRAHPVALELTSTAFPYDRRGRNAPGFQTRRRSRSLRRAVLSGAAGVCVRGLSEKERGASVGGRSVSMATAAGMAAAASTAAVAAGRAPKPAASTVPAVVAVRARAPSQASARRSRQSALTRRRRRRGLVLVGTSSASPPCAVLR